MVSQISGFAITGYINTKAPPEVAGSIGRPYYWYEGLAGWVQLPDIPPEIPLGTSLHLAIGWLNLSTEPISGYIELTIIKPDGSQVTPNDVLNQNKWATPGNGWIVQFEPITLDQVGTYQATATLSTMGQVLDETTFNVAVVPPPTPFTFSNPWVQRVRCESATAWNTLNFGCTITNPTDKSITHTLTPMYRVETKSGYSDPIARPEFAREITLSLGQSYNYYLPGNQPDRCTIIIGFSAGVPYGGCSFLRDENGNDSPEACV